MIFISYSSRDKQFAHKLASDLKELGHEVWLDEWQIKVGDDIVQALERGISEADYVIVVLSPNSISSGWVEKEWRTKYWLEINRNQVMVLPVLLQDCEIPPLLQTKKYADFRKSDSVGFVQLVGAIDPVIRQEPMLGTLQASDLSVEISGLLAKVQSRSVTLSVCLAEALALARKAGNSSLEHFCRNELKGWTEGADKDSDQPKYRLVEAFFSLRARINFQYNGWAKNPSRVFEYMREHPDDFYPLRVMIAYSVSELESLQQEAPPANALLTITRRLADVIPDPESRGLDPDLPVVGYTHADTFRIVLESIRRELTIHLLDMLPKVD